MLSWFIFFCIAFIYFAFKTSKKFRYVFKFTLFTVFSLFSGTAFVPFMLHRPGDYKNAVLPCWFITHLCRYFLGVSYELQGHENILPEGQGCVVVCNHQSALDLCVLATIWPYTPQGAMIAKKEVLWLFPFGPATKLWGTVFVDRLNPEKAQKTLNQTGELINKRKFRIVMFPEGTRNMEEEMLPFKKGAFHIAVSAQSPIQPIVTSRYHFLDSKAYKFDPGHSIIKILPAIPTKGLTKADIPDLMERTRKSMREGFLQISEEVLTCKQPVKSKYY